MSVSGKVETVYNFILKKAEDDGRPITNKVLQKLLYYSQAWNLVLNKDRLFPDDIQAWVHGPAIPDIYRKFSKYGYSAITDKADSSHFSELSDNEKQVISDVWDLYGSFDGDYLETLTHREDPWIKAREGLEPFQNSSKVIDTGIMRKYYDRKLKSAQQTA